MEATTHPASPPDSDTANLAREIAERRRDLGLPVDGGEPRASKFAALRDKLITDLASTPAPTPEQLAEREAACQRKLVREARIRVGSLIRQAGPRYAGCRLTTFVVTTDAQKRVVQGLRDYCERPNKSEGLILYGPCGTGKDHLAFSVAGHAAYNGSKVIWMYGQDWFGQVRDAMDGDTTEANLVRRICDPDLAVISDPLPPIGNLTMHQATMLYRVVQGRYQQGKPTIVTINVASDAHADERMGAPTWDRLCDSAWKVFCNWPSYRKPAREIK